MKIDDCCAARRTEPGLQARSSIKEYRGCCSATAPILLTLVYKKGVFFVKKRFSRVYLEITNICNKNCSFCPGTVRESRRMSEEEFRLSAEALRPYTDYLYFHLMGEPLCHPELPRFIKMAHGCGYKSIITTNGTLIARRGGELLSAGLHKVNISLHSFEEGGEDSFLRYVSEISAFASGAASSGVIVVFRLWNKGCDGGRNAEAIKILRELLPGDWVENTRGVRIRDKLFLEWGERFEWPDSEAKIKGERFFCYGLRDQFGILSDGTVVPCCLDSEGAIALGNIFAEDIDSILNSERARAMVSGFSSGKASEKLCKRCGYAQRFV